MGRGGVRKVGTVRWQNSAHPLSGTLEWTVVHGSETPGPGAYSLHERKNVPGGKFVGFGKTYLDQTIYNKKDVPGPAAYPLPDATNSRTGGRMSRAKVPSFVDMEQARAGALPAPGQYWKPPEMVGGGRWGSASAPSPMDMLVRRSRESPAPWDYSKVETHKLSGGKWSNSKAKSDLDWRIYYASQVPPPGHYGILPVPGGGPQGGRIGAGRNISALDELTSRARALPGPGMYDVESSYEQSFFNNKEMWLRTKKMAEGLHLPLDDTGTSALSRSTNALRGPTIHEKIMSLQNRYSEAKGLGRSKAGGEFSLSRRSTRHMLGDYNDLPEDFPPPKLLPG